MSENTDGAATGWTGGQRAFGDFARQNGCTDEELKEAITHLAFYSGGPNGMGTMSVARQVFTDDAAVR